MARNKGLRLQVLISYLTMHPMPLMVDATQIRMFQDAGKHGVNLTLHDRDADRGYYFIDAKKNINQRNRCIDSEDSIYSCHDDTIVMGIHPYHQTGNIGVSAGLRGAQEIKNGAPL